MPKLNTANNSCLVCSGASNGVCHFGVHCCRACASFFHRTMKEKRKYNCRWEQNCQISNTDGLRNSCRACRLKKCFQVGMAEEKKRDRKSCGRESSSSPSPAVDEPTSADVESILMTTSFVEALRQYNNAFRALSVVEGISTDLVGNDLGLQKARVINYQEYMRMLKGSVLLTYSMLCQQLPEIRDFNSENKAKLLKTFHNQFNLIREAQMTVQACIDPNSSFALVVPGGLINADHLEDNFFMDFPDSEQKQKFAQFVRWHFDFCRERFCPVRPNQLEFAAITGILFWNSLERAVPDALSGEQIMHRKETLFAELFTIIMRDQQQQGDTVQAAVRFGKLIDLVHQLTVHTWEMDELYAMAKIFNDLPDIWDQVVL